MADSQANGSTTVAEQSPAPGTVERIRPKALSQRDPAGIARAIAESGYWKHIQNPSQAMVIMAAGEELGLSPLAAVQGITMIEGQLGYRGNLIATLIKEHEHYDYKIVERKDDRCTLQFLIDGEPVDDEEDGKVTFTIEDAKRQELVKPRSNWVKTPRAMCFWRCLTEGSRVHFPEITAGTPVYTDDEIREVIHVPAEVEEVTDAQIAEEPERPRLSDEALDQFMQGYAIASDELGGLTPLDGLNFLLGSIGFDALEVGAEGGVREQVAYWPPEQVAAVEAEFQKALDKAAAQAESEDGEPPEEVDAEVVPEQEEATDADA